MFLSPLNTLPGNLQPIMEQSLHRYQLEMPLLVAPQCISSLGAQTPMITACPADSGSLPTPSHEVLPSPHPLLGGFFSSQV